MFSEDEWRLEALKTRYLQLLDELRRLQKRRDERPGTADAKGAPRIKRRIYLLRHPRPGFNGFFGGIDFCEGRGTTSSVLDRDRLVYELDCIDISDEAERGTKPAELESHNAAQAGRES
jgi:hypothetical protein